MYRPLRLNLSQTDRIKKSAGLFLLELKEKGLSGTLKEAMGITMAGSNQIQEARDGQKILGNRSILPYVPSKKPLSIENFKTEKYRQGPRQRGKQDYQFTVRRKMMNNTRNPKRAAKHIQTMTDGAASFSDRSAYSGDHEHPFRPNVNT